MGTNALLTLAAVVLATGLLTLAIGLLSRERRGYRAEAALQAALMRRTAEPARPGTERGMRLYLLRLLARFGQHLQAGPVGKALLDTEDQLLLDQMGWNTVTGAATYLAVRVLFALMCASLLGALAQPRLILFAVGLGAGLLLPKFALGIWGDQMRKQADNELPLLVDLLRLLQGVGLSMDQSLQIIGEDLRGAVPLLGRELAAANTAYMRGRPREQSLQRLAEGYKNDDLRSLVMLIMQVHQHGGAVQEPLKQFGERLRERRRMDLKEKVGKLSVKMTLVMMATLIPALMLVIGGPAILSLINSLSTIVKGH